jgi:hypothetical protein
LTPDINEVYSCAVTLGELDEPIRQDTMT